MLGESVISLYDSSFEDLDAIVGVGGTFDSKSPTNVYFVRSGLITPGSIPSDRLVEIKGSEALVKLYKDTDANSIALADVLNNGGAYIVETLTP